MQRFSGSLRESILGREVNLPVCSIPGKQPLEVFYTFYEGKPRSHRLEFRRGSRNALDMLLSRHVRDITRFCSLSEGLGERMPCDPEVFGFWARVALRLMAGRIVGCEDIFSGPASEIQWDSAQAASAYRYRLAYCRRGTQESVVLVSSRHGRQSSTFRKGSRTQINWLRLRARDFRTLADRLEALTNTEEFARLLQQQEIADHRR